MKKTIILCVLLIVTNLSFAQSNVFDDPEVLNRMRLDWVFKDCFVHTTVTSLSSKAKNTFKYEITYDALIIYKHVVYGTSAADATYADKWFYIPLKDLYVHTDEMVKDVFAESTEISLTTKLKRVIAGNGTKYNPAGETFLQDLLYVPFLLKSDKYKNIVEYLDETLVGLRGEVKEAIVKKAAPKKETEQQHNETAATVKKEYYPTGEIKSEIPMLNGKIEGKEIFYYKSGKLNFFNVYKAGIKNGAYEYYFENGQLRQKCNYKNDKLHGTMQEYYENGTLKNESVNIDGAYQGYVTEYDNKGKLLTKKYYVMGKMSGTLDICTGLNYLIKKLDDKEDKELGNRYWVKQNFEGILDFEYEYFSEGSYILNRASSCRLDYLPETASYEALFLQYAKIKALLDNCPKLTAGEEHNEKSSMGTLKSNKYKYNKSLFVKLEATTLSGGWIRLYVGRIENKKNGIQ